MFEVSERYKGDLTLSNEQSLTRFHLVESAAGEKILILAKFPRSQIS